MKIPLSDIPKEGLALECRMDPVTLGLEDSEVGFETPVQVSARLEVTDRTVYISGEAETRTRLQCVRCLGPLPFPLHPSFQMTLEPQESESGKVPGELHELHRGELDEHYYSGDAIDLAELVREQILLALPAYPLCRSDCRGLCPQCGADWNRTSCGCSAADSQPPMRQFQALLKRINKK